MQAPDLYLHGNTESLCQGTTNASMHSVIMLKTVTFHWNKWPTFNTLTTSLLRFITYGMLRIWYPLSNGSSETLPWTVL